MLQHAHRVVDRHALPIGQQVHRDDIDILPDLRRQQPGRPRLGRRHLDTVGQRVAHPFDVAVQLVRRDEAHQDRLVADEDAVDDAAVGERRLDAERELGLVLVRVGGNPAAQRHHQAVATRDLRHLVHAAADRVGPHPPGELGELRHVAVDLLGRDVAVLAQREHMAGRIGDAADLAFPVGRHDRVVAAGPEQDRGADDQEQGGGDPELAAPDPATPSAQKPFHHACRCPVLGDRPITSSLGALRFPIAVRRSDRRDPGPAAAAWDG